MKKWISLILALVMMICLTACGAEEETTVTGMVVSVDGNVVSLREFDGEMQGSFGGERPSKPQSGEMPQMPADMENFTMPENFDPEDVGQMPPEGFDPSSFGGSMPEGGGRPEMPADGQMPDFGSFESFSGEGEGASYDLSNAHISVEIEGGKASGTMADIVPGSFLTLTINGKGEVLNVLVSSMIGFGGGFLPGNWPEQ